MCAKTAVKTAALIISLSLFSACGELNTSLFSSGGTYQIKAMVNGSPLESCSIIRKDDKIIPYFATSVVNDPDLIGLLVYLQNSKGDVIGDRVLYTIEPVDDPTPPQEETEPEDNDNDSAETEDGTESDNPGSAGGAASETGQSEKIEKAEPELPTIMEKKTFIESKPIVINYDMVIPLKSFTEEMPPFPLPKNMDIGPYSLVFEAVGRDNTLSVTELDMFYLGGAEFRLKDISMYLPWLSDTHLIPVGSTVLLEAGLDYDSRLNPYVIWYNGRNIISEGSVSEGAGNILWNAPEQSGFYTLRVEVLPYQLNKRNFTGIIRDITLPVSVKAAQTAYFFENGPVYTAKKPLAAGTVYAEQVKLVTAQLAALAAAKKEASARSASAAAKAENADKPAPVMPEYPELLRWYRFDGSLDETSLKPEWEFATAEEKTPRWAGVGQSYGLSAGPDDVYLLRPITFFRKGEDQGGGIFLFYIRPVSEGTVFSAFFPTLASVRDGVWMDMVTKRNTITLRLKTRGTTVEMPLNTFYSEDQKFIPIVVEFYVRPYRLEAKLSLGENLTMQSAAGEIRLPGALAGDVRIKLGVDKTAPGVTAETKSVLVLPSPAENSEQTQEPEPLADFADADNFETVQQENTNENKTEPAAADASVTAVAAVTALTTVWDEFAVLYSSTPILPEEIFIEDDDPEETEKPPSEEETPVKPVVAAEIETQKEAPPASLPPAEKPKPNSAIAIPATAVVNPAETGIKNEAPLAEIKADNKTEPIEQPAETRQDLKPASGSGPLPETAETEGEEAQPLIPLP
jgi:hypothetical protein